MRAARDDARAHPSHQDLRRLLDCKREEDGEGHVRSLEFERFVSVTHRSNQASGNYGAQIRRLGRSRSMTVGPGRAQPSE